MNRQSLLVTSLLLFTAAFPAAAQDAFPRWGRGAMFGGAPLPATNVIRMLVVRVACQDAEPPCPESELAASTFGETNSINAVFQASSYGKWRVEGEAVSVRYEAPKATLHVAAAGRSDWFQQNIDPLVVRQGRETAGYQKILYVLPPGVSVWSGNFDIGKPRLYTADGARPKVAAHELAHTFGMQHSSTAAPLAGHEYGDHADILGGGHDSPLAQMNAPRALKFGFIPPSAVQDAESGGAFALEAIEVRPDQAKHKQVLRIHRAGDGQAAEYYYLSLRRPIGIDANLAGYSHAEINAKSYVNCLSVHRFRPEAFGYKEKMTGLVALLKEKESFLDQESGIRVTLEALADGIARVTVARVRPAAPAGR